MIFSTNGVLFRGEGKKLLKLLGKANAFLFAQKKMNIFSLKITLVREKVYFFFSV